MDAMMKTLGTLVSLLVIGCSAASEDVDVAEQPVGVEADVARGCATLRRSFAFESSGLVCLERRAGEELVSLALDGSVLLDGAPAQRTPIDGRVEYRVGGRALSFLDRGRTLLGDVEYEAEPTFAGSIPIAGEPSCLVLAGQVHCDGIVSGAFSEVSGCADLGRGRLCVSRVTAKAAMLSLTLDGERRLEEAPATRSTRLTPETPHHPMCLSIDTCERWYGEKRHVDLHAGEISLTVTEATAAWTDAVWLTIDDEAYQFGAEFTP